MNVSRQQRIIDHFRRSISSYDDGAKVQKMVGDCLIDKVIANEHIHYGRVLEVGCCTGTMTEALCRKKAIGKLWLNDLVPECCTQAAERIKNLVYNSDPIAGDIEQISIPEKLDLVVSSSTFQWLRDLPAAFDKFAEALNRQGFLAFTMFGPGTMWQVRELIGIGLDYIDEDRLKELLERRYCLVDLETSRSTLYFQSPMDVLRHIQSTGVGGAGTYKWTPGKLRSFDRQYRQQFQTENGIPLDYVSTCVIAQKGENLQ